MLPAAHRLCDGDAFRSVTRRGERAGSRTLVAHLRLPEKVGVSDAAPLVGFVVSRQVGSAVVRNRVKRRLRHSARAWLGTLPNGSALVVRARPSAAGASFESLSADLARTLTRFGLDRP